jgi:hypothetical protein
MMVVISLERKTAVERRNSEAHRHLGPLFQL